MSKWNSIIDAVKTGFESLTEKASGIPELEKGISKAQNINKNIREIGKVLRNENPYHTGDIGLTMLKAGMGAVGGISARALYNQVEDKSGGYGSSALMGAFAGTMIFGPSRTKRLASTFLKRNPMLHMATSSTEDFVFSNLIKGVSDEKSLFHLKDYSKAANVYSHILGATRGAIIGAGVGGMYGTASDKQSVLGGTFKGAFLGALAGGLFGSNVPPSSMGLKELRKEVGNIAKNKAKFSASQRKSARILLKSIVHGRYNARKSLKFNYLRPSKYNINVRSKIKARSILGI